VQIIYRVVSYRIKKLLPLLLIITIIPRAAVILRP